MFSGLFYPRDFLSSILYDTQVLARTWNLPSIVYGRNCEPPPAVAAVADLALGIAPLPDQTTHTSGAAFRETTILCSPVFAHAFHPQTLVMTEINTRRQFQNKQTMMNDK